MASGGDDDEAVANAVAIGEFRIFPGRVLPGLRTGAATAYQAESREWPLNEYYAVVCDPAAQPRLDVIATIRKVDAAGLVTPIDWRVLEWPGTGRRHLVIVYLKPVGGRLVETLGDAMAPIPEDDVVRDYLVPLVPSLSALHVTGVAHGGINPTNIVFRDVARTQPMLGECVSSAAAMRQPGWFLPIETAMTMPAGRGIGQRGDDIFALGMTTAMLLLGGDPTAGMPDEELLCARIDRGSFATLVGENRLSSGINEMLRGLLADDPKMRWTIKEVEAWLPARRVAARQGTAARRAIRPLEFDGKVFSTGPALAHAFAAAVPAAAEVVRSKDFETWIKRALNDEHSAKLLPLAHGEGMTGVAPDRRDDVLVARMCISLDSSGPVRYRGVSTTVDGYGGALAAAFFGNGSVQHLAEAMTVSLPQFWLSARQPIGPEHIALHKTFDQLRNFLADRRFGFGIERVLYELNPTLHCLSPLVEADYVVTLA
ncbi:MAG: serine/threonine protein kinase, partial [Rhodospirillales bacterium]|nr:serine/threonine protein kinase [Rhodospirillales bacterium]